MKSKVKKTITVYCSSSNKVNKKYINLAKNLGEYIAKKNFKLVYGGGSNGLMGVVSENAKSNGAHVTGIIPKFLQEVEKTNKNVNKTIVVKDMATRKQLLYKKADVFIVLPGGPGTLEELTEIISWKNLNLHKKTIIIINYNKFWNSLIKVYKKYEIENFMDKKIIKLFYIVNNINELKKII